MSTQTCASAVGGGRYRCSLPPGHDGRHRAAGVFLTWDDRATGWCDQCGEWIGGEGHETTCDDCIEEDAA